MYTQNSCTHSRKHEREVTSKWRHSVGSFTSYPFQLEMMLENDNTPRRVERSTQVIRVTNTRRTLEWLKSEQARVGHIETQCACTAAVTKSQGAHTCYSSDVPFYNSFFTDTLYHVEQCTLLLLPQQVDIQCTETNSNTTYIDIAVFVFRVSILILSVQCVPIIKFQWSFVLHIINEFY